MPPRNTQSVSAVPCSRCRSRHPRPVGRNCSRPLPKPAPKEGQSDASADNASERSGESRGTGNPPTKGHIQSSSIQTQTASNDQTPLTSSPVKTTDSIESTSSNFVKSTEFMALGSTVLELSAQVQVLSKILKGKKSVTVSEPATQDPREVMLENLMNASNTSHDFVEDHRDIHIASNIDVSRPNAISNLRNDVVVQNQVSDRLKQLEHMAQTEFSSANSQGKLIKSGRERTGGNDAVRQYISWPQEHVFVGTMRKRVKYDDLTQPQLSAGLLAIANQERDISKKNNMISYFTRIHQDMIDFNFQSVLGANGVVFSALEEGRLSWYDLDMIFELKSRFLVNSLPNLARNDRQQYGHSGGAGRPRNRNAKPCSKFNTGQCTLPGDHLVNGANVAHICAFCYTQGLRFSHSERTCRKRSHTPPTS